MRSVAAGIGGAVVGAIAGAALGWYAIGTRAGAPARDALIGLVLGALGGFALLGPRDSWLVAVFGTVGLVGGGFGGVLFAQRPPGGGGGFEDIGYMLGGAVIGLLCGIWFGGLVMANRRQ